MDDADAFHRGIIRYGGRLPRNWPPGSPSEQVYTTIERWAGTLISSARQLVPRLPPIHFDFVLNGSPNAFAFKVKDRYFIGMTTGMRYMLELIFYRMLSDRQLVPFIGRPAEELESVPVLRGYTQDAQKLYEAGVTPQRPRDHGRWQYAVYLVHEAILFLVGHEIAHISRGHVDYLGFQTGHALIAEVSGENSDQLRLIERQTLEMDADQRSVSSRVSSLKLTHEARHLPAPVWAMEREPPGLLLFHWAFSMNSLFRLLGDGRFTPSELTRRDYPPLPLRRAVAMLAAYAFVMMGWNPELKKPTLAALRMAARHTEEAFGIILGENVTRGGMPDAFSPIGQGHHKRLIECWTGGLRDRVARFAYELEPIAADELPPVIPDQGEPGEVKRPTDL